MEHPGTNTTFTKTVAINAPADVVWQALTDKRQMLQWMSEAVTDIVTDWTVGSTIIITGQVYKKQVESRGKILVFQPPLVLEYTHLSSLSRLPDTENNHCRLRFTLSQTEGQTRLHLTIQNFPTDAIYHHMAFYWNVTLELLKKYIEGK